MRTLIKQFIQAFIVLLIGISITITGLNVAYAYDGTKNLDTTDPLADLRQDESFDVSKYPFKANADFELVNLTEYCYSFYPEHNKNFGLYVYVYNPQGLIFNDTSLNRIQMAVGYDKDGNPNDYKKYELKLVNCSKGNGYSWLFYKFKVIDDGTIYDRLISTERRYDVSGLELVTEGWLNASESGVSKTFIYTGFSAGYGPNGQTESTLKCDYDVLETVELKVNHTYWRSKSSNRGVGYQNQLDSVYFTVPNSLLEEYGKLQRIKAEWYEYLTKDVLVTSNQEVYNAVKNYIGKSDLSGLEYGFAQNLQEVWLSEHQTQPYYKADWSFNPSVTAGNGISGSSALPLFYLFPTANWCEINAYDPYGDITSTGGVSGNALYEYIINYSKKASSKTLSIKDGVISADLFESDIEEYRKVDNEYGKIQNGYSYYDFDADLDFLTWDVMKPGSNHDLDLEYLKIYGFWDWFIGDSFGNEIDTGIKELPPIMKLSDSDLTGDFQEISDRLYVNYNDVSKIKALQEQAKKNDETVILFRFALSDYYSKEVNITQNRGSNSYYIKQFNGEAYRAKQSVFLDFDIIQLTFSRNEKLTVIPAVANPIDIVNDITSPTIVSGHAWWETVLAYVITIIASILGLIVAVGVFKTLLSIYNGDMNIVGKILFTLPVLAVLALILIYALPWVISTVNGLGGL